jgi:hypothetical protein
MLSQLSIAHDSLHNAGNDDAYALKAFVKMVDCIKNKPQGVRKVPVAAIPA